MNLKTWIKRYPMAAFFVLAYALSWAVLMPLAIVGEKGSSYSLPFVVVSDFGPALAALLVVRVSEGREGLRRWASRLVRWRVHLGWYGVALLIPFLLVIVGYGIYLAFGGAPVEGWRAPSPLLFLVTLLFIFFLGGAQEEPGWRGFALPRLQARYSALTSSLILGGVWALWHGPKFLLPGTTQSELPFLWYAALTPAVTIIVTWIFNSTRGSVLPGMVFHAAVNTAPGLLPLDAEGGLISMRVAVLIAAWLAVAVLIGAFGPTRLAAREDLVGEGAALDRGVPAH